MSQKSNVDRLNAHWMPFTAMRDFREAPRLVEKANGHYYTDVEGRQLYDSFSGLWTCGLGHGHPKIIEAVQNQVAEMGYAIGFQVSHPKAFDLAERLVGMAPEGFSTAFFTNSGSEAADTALKIAIAYHRAKGEANRTRFVGRARGYHGTNFGGMSVGGIVPNRKVFSPVLLPGVDHLPHTHNLEHNAFSKGLPEWGAHLADDLLNICALHDGSNIAAVMVEPVAGSTGVLPPPVGYLRRLREICTQHGILLIFDEVITAFGRVGAAFAAERFDVIPDMITTAKGLTNGIIPMGAVLIKKDIHETLMDVPAGIELFHGYTYSGHPMAAATGLAVLDIYEEEDSFAHARVLEPVFEEAIHNLKGAPHVIDIRNFGLMGAIELAPREGAPGARGMEVHKKCFWDEAMVVRNGMDILQFSPFLNAREEDIHRTFEVVERVLKTVE